MQCEIKNILIKMDMVVHGVPGATYVGCQKEEKNPVHVDMFTERDLLHQNLKASLVLLRVNVLPRAW